MLFGFEVTDRRLTYATREPLWFRATMESSGLLGGIG